jgi:hypothetical protein
MTATYSWLWRGPDHHQWVGTTVAYREWRDRRRAIRRCAVGVIVFALGGAAIASWLLPPPPRADSAAKAFVEARVEGDTARVWDLLCAPARAHFADYDAFARSENKRFMYFKPPDVDVSTGTVRGALTSEGAAAVVAVSVTRPDGWFADSRVSVGEVTVIVEDGEFRVCGLDGRRVTA